MARSATDATRFTSTTPHATTKPPPAMNPARKGTPAKKPGPPGETPQEKVRRLRAAADRARDAKVSSFDRFLVRGRSWADRAHRLTAVGLIGITVIATGVTIYAMGDMMLYNRKKRTEFYAEQKARKESAIYTARNAIAAGTATPEQVAFIQREDEHDAQVAAFLNAKREKKGLITQSKDWLFSGMKKEEEGEDVGSSERRLGYESVSEEDDSLGERESDIVRALEDKKQAIADKFKDAFAEEKQRQKSGGPLDRLGTGEQNTPNRPVEPRLNDDEDEPPKKAGGWTSFMVRR